MLARDSLGDPVIAIQHISWEIAILFKGEEWLRALRFRLKVGSICRSRKRCRAEREG